MRRHKWIAVVLLLCVLLSACSAAVPEAPAPTPTASPTAEPPATPEPTATPSPAPTATPESTATPEPTATPAPTPAPPTAEELLRGMTLEAKVAQMFFVRCPDVGAKEMLTDLQPGGLLLFSRDFEGLTAEQITEKLSGYQAVMKLPLLIGTDEEGGTVVRVSSNRQVAARSFWSPRALYAQGGAELLCRAEGSKCDMLQALGINVNFAPVCDLSDDPTAFMYDRSLGLSAEDTAGVITQLVEVYTERKTGCVLKHFPGYGNAADTHEGVVFDDRPFEDFESADLLPFAAGIEAGADCVLVAHNIVPCVDAEKPASLSPAWHELLREKLGFEGVIITDDLGMGAVSDYTDNASAAVEAVLAGNDMLCCSNYAAQYPAVLAAVQNGEIAESRIDESVLRILRWKLELGLIR